MENEAINGEQYLTRLGIIEGIVKEIDYRKKKARHGGLGCIAPAWFPMVGFGHDELRDILERRLSCYEIKLREEFLSARRNNQ